MTKLHESQKTSKDSTGAKVITSTQLIARTYGGEVVAVNGGNGRQEIERLGDGRYSVDGAGRHTLEGLQTWLGSYHCEFGESVFWAA